MKSLILNENIRIQKLDECILNAENNIKKIQHLCEVCK